MAEIDPNIALGVRPVQFANPLELAGGAMQLRNLGLQGQNAQITLEQNRRSLQDQKTIADLYRANTNPDGSINHAGIEQGLAQAGLGDKIPAYQEQVGKASKETTAAEAAQFTLHKQKLDLLNSGIASLLGKPNLNHDDVTAQINTFVNQGLITPQQGAEAARNTPGRPEELRPFLIQKGMEAMDASQQITARLATAPKYNEQDRGSVIDQGTVDPTTGIRTSSGTTVAKSMTPDQAAKIQLAKSGALTDDTKQFMAERLLNGEKASAVLGNLGRGAQGAADLRDVQNLLPTLAKQKGIGAGQLANIMQNTAADARTLTELGAREGKIAPRVQEAINFGEVAKTASADVPRGTFVPWNRLSQMTDASMSDPKLAKLKAATNSLINAYAAAVGGGSPTVHDKEAAEHMLSTAQSPEAYNAVVDQLILESQKALDAPGQVRARLNAGAGRTTPDSSAPPADIQALLDKHGSK
jgi:hypothetical protein